MTLDIKAAGFSLSGLRSIPTAITTAADGRRNGCIVLSAGPSSVIAEAPRVMVGLSKCNLTHDLVMQSGLFTMHTLAADPDEQLERSLAIIQGLAGGSGRDGDKLAQFDTKTGVTGVPILLDAMSYVEGRVVASLDVEENTVFVADVVASERFRPGAKLDVGTAWNRLPKDWVETYERNHEDQVDDARTRRGLPLPEGRTHG